jgi:hypothetical protein
MQLSLTAAAGPPRHIVRSASVSVIGLLIALLAALALASSAQATVTHYCNATLAGHGGCESAFSGTIAYNEVDSATDAQCEDLTTANPLSPPDPTTTIFPFPEDCISTGTTSAGTHYNAGSYHPYVGNRHTFSVTETSATHFDA